MCYPYLAGDYQSENHRRRLVSLMAAAMEEATTARQPPQVVNIGGRLAGGGGGAVRVCLCSPTNHPGSFRCRQHHGEYQWVNRLGSKPS